MSKRNLLLLCVVTALFLVATAIPTKSNTDPITTLIAGRNVNMVSGTELPDGDPYLQRQNEPSIAVSTRNPLHLLAGANDYRSIDIAMEDELPGFEQTSSAPAPDAWLGVFKSIDGGSTWKSTLLPGFSYFDTTPPGAPFSPLYGFSAAADPVVRAGPNGLFFYAGITFNREDRGDSAVFVSRFIDNNNKENVDTTAYIDTQIQARGNAGQFIDKPWLAVDVPYQEEPSIPIDLPYLQDPYTDRQYVTRCNVYLAYSVFLGNPYKTPRTKIYFARSTDSGMTWDKPTKLTETQHINQGAVIAIDPRGNGHVYVAWRRFAHMNNKGKIIQPDAIVVAKSEDGGRRFSKPIVVAELAPWFPPSDDGVFDQATTAESFRTNDYPTMAVDHNGTAYIAWAQRGLGPDINPGTGVGEARIVMTASSNGDNWSTPEQVISYEEGDPPGHQFMPQLTYAAGKLTLLWYDQRWDVIQEYLPFIEDIYTNVRHTIDVRVAQAEIHSYPEFSPSTQVSKYPFLLWPSDTPGYFNALQLLHNKPNLPIFAHGTVPFMGDYIGIAPSPMFLPPQDPNNPTDYWIYNTDPLTPTHYHAVWTDNRDVIPPGEDNWLGDWDQYNAPGSGCNDETLTGVRNQNIYTSRISEGILAGSPGNTKPLNILRSFVVFVHNTTKFEKFFTLEIEKPDDMLAYFWQEGGGQPENIPVSVPPYSYLSNTILVGQYTPDEYASIIINIKDDKDNLVSYVTLNPDSTNPWLDQPEGVDPDNPHARNEGETHTPHARNYTIVEWNTELQDPYINTIYPQYEEAIANNDGVTPYPVDGQEQNPHARNPHARNPHARNPHARNNVLNPHARNENIPSDIPEGSHMTDVIRTIENTGNTTTSYSINTFPTPEDLPDGVLAQLIVFKTYTTPTVDPYGSEDPNSEGTNGCELVEQEHQEVIVMKSPHARNLSELGDISVLVPPKGTFHVLYRFYNPYQSTEQQEFHDEEKFEEAVPDIESDVPDTDPDDPTQPLPEPPSLLVIPPQALPDAVVGNTFYSVAIQAEGGTGIYGNWMLIEGTSLPGGLSLDPDTGIISSDPSPAAAGTYTFKVQVNDFDEDDVSKANPLQTATKTLSIRVVEPLDITTTSLYDAFNGGGYLDILDAIGGTETYTWSIISGSPPDFLELTPGTNRIEGTVDDYATTSTFTVQVTDSGSPAQIDTQELTIYAYAPPQVTTPSPLPDGTVGTSYSKTLAGNGGNTPYTWSVFSGALPPGLILDSVSGEISGKPTTEGNYSFQIHMTDDSNPNQTAGMNFSITINLSPAVFLEITGSSSMTAGTSNELTITAYDENYNVATGYSGPKSLWFSGLDNAPDGSIPKVEDVNMEAETAVNFTNGVSDAGAATLVAYKAENTSLDVTDGTIDTSFEDGSYDLFISVDPGGAAKLLWITQPTSPIAQGATWDTFSVEITDQYNNRKTNATNAVTLTPVTLGGTRTRNPVNGVSTFSDIYYDGSGTISVQGTNAILTSTPAVNVDVLRVLDNVPNPSFENGTGTWPDGWIPVDSGTNTHLWDVDYVYDGSRSVGMTCGESCAPVMKWITTDFIRIDNSKDYQMSVKFRWPGSWEDGNYSGLAILFYDAYGNRVEHASIHVIRQFSGTMNDWSEINITFSDHAGYTDSNKRPHIYMGKIYLSKYSNTQPSGATVWFDLVSLSIITP